MVLLVRRSFYLWSVLSCMFYIGLLSVLPCAVSCLEVFFVVLVVDVVDLVHDGSENVLLHCVTSFLIIVNRVKLLIYISGR